jgi:P27 family predicted phage terminase small subunit
MGDVKAPRHLSAASRRWYRQVADEFVLEAHHLKVLQAAAEAWDRMQQAQREIAVRGLLIEDRFGVPKANPAVNIERDARTAFLRAVRELDLDLDPPKELPRVVGRR